jgi:hypothetical protein
LFPSMAISAAPWDAALGELSDYPIDVYDAEMK